MQLSQPTLEPHSLCYTCWVRLCTHSCLFSTFSSWLRYCCSVSADDEGVRSVLPVLRGLLGVRLPVDVPVAPCSASDESYRLCIMLPHTLYQTFVINVMNNIHTRFIISFYMICAVIYCSFCCIYVWLDPGTYMIARFMSFYKPCVTEWYQSYIDYRTKA